MTAGLLIAHLAAAPPLSDPLGAPLPAGLHLTTPWLYALFGPLFSLWDGVSMLGMSRLRGFLIGLLLAFLLWRSGRALWWQFAWSDAPPPRSPLRRELKLLAGSILLVFLFVLVGLLWHRPMLALAGVDRDDAAVDFHSHTNVSHDVRHTLMRMYDTESNLRWHRRAGFDAVFITDHNTVEGLRPHVGPPARCPGIEVSAWKAHIVLLGDSLPVDQRRYDSSMDALLTLLRSSDSAYGALSLASLPEYERNQWGALDRLVEAGLDGFEIVNAAPKANEVSPARRDSVIALARKTNRFVAGVSDNHGWGATSMVWNLVRVPGWREAPGTLCPGILGRLRLGFPAVRVIERHRLRTESGWPVWLTPAGVLWETWRSMSWPLTVSWLAWTWAWWAIRHWRRS
ncbi:MAG: PHP domain-containing protein [Gemmatimonadales bacterium]